MLPEAAAVKALVASAASASLTSTRPPDGLSAFEMGENFAEDGSRVWSRQATPSGRFNHPPTPVHPETAR